MTIKDLQNLVSSITGYEVTRVVKTGEGSFKVLVKGSVYPHDRFNVTNSLPITVHVTLEEGWE